MMRVSRSWLLPCLVGLLVFLYRFNTLSGESGGFDNDHFINLARANQLLAGEWPLRDYADASLQGAWPPVTYLASAGAQILFGDSLLAEGLLTTAAVAIAAVLTLLAANELRVPPVLAVGAVLASVLPSVKLYGYARPLLFAAGALLLFRYVKHPSPARLVALSLFAAVSFLVRHDYAVYLGIGIAVTLLVRHRDRPLDGVARVAACGAIALVLLAPSILGVQYMVGLDAYVEGARALMADETSRTNLKWPTFDVTSLWAEQNTLAALYYLYLALPAVAGLAALWRAHTGDDPTEMPKILGIAAMGAVCNHFLLRGNLEGRLADPAVLHALTGIWLIAIVSQRAVRRAPGQKWWTLAAALSYAIAVVSMVALGRVGAADREFRTAGFSEGVVTTWKTTLRVAGRLHELPPARWEPLPDRGAMLAAAYLNRCTRPTDRIINTTYDTEFLVFARRRFAAGRVNFVPGFYASEREQVQAVALARRQAAPVALTDPPPDDDWLEEDFPIFNAFLRERYVDAGTIRESGEPYLRVLVLRDLPERGTFGHTGLPCFQ
jgi:hypothetical protein